MIVIAHRLQTIIKSDKVMVMDKGKCIEFAAPQELLKNPKSRFTKLVNLMQKEEDDNKKTEELEKWKNDKDSDKQSSKSDWQDKSILDWLLL